jgi:hypothetical protein
VKRRHLVLAMQPGQPMVEDQDDAPLVGEGQPRHHRRHSTAAAAAGVDDDPAAVEAGNADAGALAARQKRCIAADIERQAVQRAQRCGHRECDLRAGTEARMARDGALDHQAVMRADAELPR